MARPPKMRVGDRDRELRRRVAEHRDGGDVGVEIGGQRRTRADLADLVPERRDAGQHVDDGRALRVAAEHDPRRRGIAHAIALMWLVASVAPSAAGQEVVGRRVVHAVRADGAAADLRASAHRRRPGRRGRCRGFVGAACEDHLDVGHGPSAACGRRAERLVATLSTAPSDRAEPGRHFQQQSRRPSSHTTFSHDQPFARGDAVPGGRLRPGGLGDPLGAVALAGQCQSDEDHAPPTAWVSEIASPSSAHAASTANSTSASPTSEANRGRSRAMPMIPSV